MKVYETRPFKGYRSGERRGYYLRFVITTNAQTQQLRLCPQDGVSGEESRLFKPMALPLADLAEFLHANGDIYLGEEKAWRWCAKHYGLE